MASLLFFLQDTSGLSVARDLHRDRLLFVLALRVTVRVPTFVSLCNSVRLASHVCFCRFERMTCTCTRTHTHTHIHPYAYTHEADACCPWSIFSERVHSSRYAAERYIGTKAVRSSRYAAGACRISVCYMQVPLQSVSNSGSLFALYTVGVCQIALCYMQAPLQCVSNNLAQGLQ